MAGSQLGSCGVVSCGGSMNQEIPMKFPGFRYVENQGNSVVGTGFIGPHEIRIPYINSHFIGIGSKLPFVPCVKGWSSTQ